MVKLAENIKPVDSKLSYLEGECEEIGPLEESGEEAAGRAVVVASTVSNAGLSMPRTASQCLGRSFYILRNWPIKTFSELW